MAALSVVNPTLLDLASLVGPNNEVLPVVEAMSQDNEMLDDMSWVVGNLPTGHTSAVRTGLPNVSWRKFYQGIQPSKGRQVQVTDTCGMLEAISEIDKALAQLNNMSATWMASADAAFLEAMSQEIQRVLIYGNEGTQPESFTGIMSRYNSLSAPNAQNLIAAGGSGTDNASILLVHWHPSQIHGIIPKGSVGGFQRTWLGEDVAENIDGSNGRALVYRTHYRWDAGLAVPDWRSNVRICNIDKSDMVKTAATGADLADLMFQALEVVPRAAAKGRPVFYMSRAIMTMLRRQVANKTVNSTLTVEDVGGKKITSFQGVPIKRVDAMAADETLVT